jgi:uncharacterized membrane protein
VAGIYGTDETQLKEGKQAMKKISKVSLEQAKQRIKTILQQAGLGNVLLVATKDDMREGGLSIAAGNQNNLALAMVEICHGEEGYRECS